MKTAPIRIAIADDHQLFREGMSLILSRNERMEVIFDVPDGEALIQRLESSDALPHVVLLDLKMPVKDGAETTKILRELFPEIKVLILTMIEQDDYILHLLNMGANGYLLKNATAEEVYSAVTRAVENGFYFNDHVSQVLLKGLQKKRRTVPALNNQLNITQREREVLGMLCQELTTADIAEQLFLSIRTVETHRKNLMEKLGARNTAGIIYRALKQGIIELN